MNTAPPKPVLVTGANGYLASHTVDQLLSRGYRVRGTVRDEARADALRTGLRRKGTDITDLDIRLADLQSPDDWADAVQGCHHILHMASPFPLQSPRDPDEVIRPATEGALNVLKAAVKEGISRVVMTSSMAAVCYGHSKPTGYMFNEDDWTDPDDRRLTPYIRSKALAEQSARSFARKSGMDLRVIAPGLILGPLLLPGGAASVEVVRKLINGDVPGCPRLGWPIADVRDVAAAHIAAMEHKLAWGERFLVSGPFLWMSDVAETLRCSCPDLAAKTPRRQLPDWVVRILGMFDADIGAVTFQLSQRYDLSTQKAETMLGWGPRPVDQTLADTARSLSELEG